MEILFDQLESPSKYQLFPDPKAMTEQCEYTWCPAGGKHGKRGRRIGQLRFVLKHNDRQQHPIWGGQIAVRESVVERFKHEGFSGFRTQPASVTDWGSMDRRRFLLRVRPLWGQRLCSERA